MSFYGAIAGIVIGAVGAVLEGISAAITGIRSTQTGDNKALKTQLLVASATVGIGTLFVITSLVFLFMYRVKSKYVKSTGLGVLTLIFGILGIILYIIGATIAGVLSNQYKDDPVVYNALRTAAVLVAVGLGLLILSFIILYSVIGKKIPGGKRK